jgi:hypothetical protein
MGYRPGYDPPREPVGGLVYTLPEGPEKWLSTKKGKGRS